MSMRLQARTKTQQPSAFTPVNMGVFQRKSAYGRCDLDTDCENETVPPTVQEVLNSPGRPLDSGTRAFMEPRFGHDFSQVRVHTDAKAVESARAVNALAYTAGRHVVFGAGQFSPYTGEGRWLLGHELTHVVQQDGRSDTIQCWHPDGHEQITRDAGLAVGLPVELIFFLLYPSTTMDFRPKALKYNANVLFSHKAEPIEEAPNHGEGGLYTMTDRDVAASINEKRQEQYLKNAISLQREYNELLKMNPLDSVSGSKAFEIYVQLGHALHVAQDRGSHEEGLNGKGHERKDIKCDNISQNASGYTTARMNSENVLKKFKLARGYDKSEHTAHGKMMRVEQQRWWGREKEHEEYLKRLEDEREREAVLLRRQRATHGRPF